MGFRGWAGGYAIMSSAIANHVSFAAYRKHNAENNSGLKHMGKSPKEYLYRKTHGRDDTEALSLGRHVHTAVLEPELFATSVVEWTGGLTGKGEHSMRRGTKAHKDFMADADAKGFEVLTSDEMKTCSSVHAAVHGNADVAQMLETSDKEVSIFWQHRFGLACKMRADILRTGSIPLLADLKTCQDASPDAFARAAAKYEYHVQLGMYQAGVKALIGQEVPVYIIAAEKTPPFDCVVYEVPQQALDVGRGVFEDRLLRVAKCRESGKWPGAGEGIETLELPNWVFEEDMGTLTMMDGTEVAV
jgi:hypothetical protein